MNKIKETYERPTTDLLVIRFEQGLLTGSVKWGASNQAATMDDEDDDRSYSF